MINLKPHYKKILLVFLLIILAASLANNVIAQTTTTKDIVGPNRSTTENEKRPTESVQQVKSAGLVAYVLVWVGSNFLTMMASMVNWAVDFGNDVVSLDAVQTAWNIVLQFTNLGFVLAIIVIAFATILRIESYGMKKLLFKLVVAALLVNFSLVFAGAFISVSNVVSDIFLKKTSADSLSNALMNATQIQKFSEVKSDDWIGWFTSLFSLDAWLKYLASLLFIIIFTFLTAVTFLVLFIMLLARAVALIILLITSPIIWLMWIFPSTEGYWKQWWTEFLRWNFFAPAVLFFVYLTVLTAGGLNKISSIQNLSQSKSAQASGNTLMLADGFVQHTAELFVILALLYGGIYVANKIGVKGGSLGVKWAEGVGKGAGAWAGKKGKQYGTAPLRAKIWKDEQGKRTQSVGEKLVGWGKNRPRIAKWTGFGLLAKGITRLETTGGENILKQHEKAVGGMTNNDLKAAALTASGPRKIAVMKELQKRKSLGDVNAKELITEENKALFGRYRQGVAWDDVEHGAKMNVKIAEELRKTGNATLESVREFVKTYKGKDIEPSVIKDLYSGKAKLGLSRESVMELGDVFADAFARENHQMVPKIIPTMDAKERNAFSVIYDPAVRNTGDNNKIKAWENTLSNYAMGFSAEAVAGATPAAPPPA